MRKRVVAVAALAAAALALTGCGQTYATNGVSGSPITVDVNGREVDCVVTGSGGVDCDWDSAR